MGEPSGFHIRLQDKRYAVLFKQKHLGWLEMADDGYYHFWHDERSQGCWSAWHLRAIAELMDEVNKEWDDKITADMDMRAEYDLDKMTPIPKPWTGELKRKEPEDG